VSQSQRRKIGDRVWVEAGAGFGASAGTWATIPNTPANRDPDLFPCMVCANPDCREWDDVWTDEDEPKPLYHVPECRMHDAPPSGA